MFIVDGQVHIWPANTPERPWPVEDPPHTPHKGRASFSKDELLSEMDTAGVDRAVLVPPSWQGYGNEVVLEAVRLHPDRFTAMGLLDIRVPDAREQIRNWRKQPGMSGLRFSFRIKGDATDDWVWKEVEAAGAPIMLVGSKQLSLVDRAAERHPGLKMVIDHLAIPRRTKDAAAFADIDKLLPLARHPNVAVKASSLPSYTSEPYPCRGLHPVIRRFYDAFGPKRLFWGSDLSKLPCTYRQAVTLFTEEIPWLTTEDKEWIMGRGLCEWIGWQLP